MPADGRSRDGAEPNGTVEIATEDLKRLVAALRAAQAGESGVRLPTRRRGLVGEIATAFNELARAREQTANELLRLSRVIGREARMIERAQPEGLTGTWKESLDSVNAIIDDLVRPTREVARVIDAVAEGDLSQKMKLKIAGRPVKGEFQRIGLTVNAMVDELSSFAAEVTRVAREVGTEGKLGGQAQAKGISGVWKDLTDNVNTLAGNLTGQVRRAEERAQAAQVLATVGEGVCLVDGAGVVRLWNPAAEAITGLAAAEVTGRRAQEVLPGWTKLAPRVPVASDPGTASTRATTGPVQIGDRELWLSFSGVGFEGGTVYAFRDLTEERALESMRQEFVATVSHELRTPLAAIYGSALTMRRADIDLGDHMRDQLLGVIAEESDHLAEIVNNLLLASHLDSGRLNVSTEPCDGRALAAQVVDAARTHVAEGVELELDAPDGLPPVEADPGQLQQVLTNVVDNAIKYSPDGGTITVQLAAKDRFLRFAVIDYGLGIPVSEQARIFEKFYRLDPNMTRGIGGTGLGLYICRELARRVDGRLWVESQEGKGSTFNVEIPLADGAASADRKGAADRTVAA